MSRVSYVTSCLKGSDQKVIQRHSSQVTPRSSRKSSRVDSEEVHTQRKQQSFLTLHKLEGEVKQIDSRLQQLENSMIKEMKRLQDQDESCVYRQMNGQRKLLRKKIQIVNLEHREACERLNQLNIMQNKRQLREFHQGQPGNERFTLKSHSHRSQSLHSQPNSTKNPQNQTFSKHSSQLKPSQKSHSRRNTHSIDQPSLRSSTAKNQKNHRLTSQNLSECFENPKQLKIRKKLSKEVCTQTGTEGGKNMFEDLTADSKISEGRRSLRRRFDPTIKVVEYDFPMTYSADLDDREQFSPLHLPWRPPVSDPGFFYSAHPLDSLEAMYHSASLYPRSYLF